MAVSIAAAGDAGDDSGDRIHEFQAILLRVGRTRFGSPIPKIEERIRSIQDLKHLEKLLTQLIETTSWQALFPSE